MCNEGSPSIVDVPGEVPTARVYIFGFLVLQIYTFLAILVDFSLGKGMLLTILVNNFGNSCK